MTDADEDPLYERADGAQAASTVAIWLLVRHHANGSSGIQQRVVGWPSLGGRIELMILVSVFLLLSTCVCVACGDDSSSGSNNNTSQGHCGDGNLDTGEECDAGAANSDSIADACRTTCHLAGCSDGVVDTGEICDDGELDWYPKSTCWPISSWRSVSVSPSPSYE